MNQTWPPYVALSREICALCSEVSRVGFWVPNQIWEAVALRGHMHDIVCLRCFTAIADEKGVEWDREITFFPVSFISHQSHIGSMDETS